MAPFFQLSRAVGSLMQDYTNVPANADPVALNVEEQMARNWYAFCQGPTNAQGIMQAGEYFMNSVRGIRNVVS